MYINVFVFIGKIVVYLSSCNGSLAYVPEIPPTLTSSKGKLLKATMHSYLGLPGSQYRQNSTETTYDAFTKHVVSTTTTLYYDCYDTHEHDGLYYPKIDGGSKRNVSVEAALMTFPDLIIVDDCFSADINMLSNFLNYYHNRETNSRPRLLLIGDILGIIGGTYKTNTDASEKIISFFHDSNGIISKLFPGKQLFYSGNFGNQSGM